MSGHAQLTYRDLDKAYAFTRGSHDEDGVVAAVDHPEFYCCTKADGVHRAALPPIVDRGTVSFRDAEDELIARIDGDVETEEDVEADGCDDLALMDEDDDADQEYEAAWLDMIEQASPVVGAPAPAPARILPVEVRTRRVPAAPAPRAPSLNKQTLRAADDELAPVAISSRRAALATHGMGQLDDVRPEVTSWKDTSTAPTQFERHRRRPSGRPAKRAAI